MALEGSLSDFGLADILQLIYFQRKTGVLTLSGKMDRVKLMFTDGNITGAESKRRTDDNRLGKILVKKGVLKDSDLQSAIEEQKKCGEQIGSILIKEGLVSREVISEMLKGQVSEMVIQLFNWKQGTYEFSAAAVPQDRDLSFSLDTQHLLMEGLRIVDEWSVIKERISLDAVFRATPGYAGSLSEDERDVLGYVDGENDVSTIVDLCGKDNFEVSRVLIELTDKGVVEPVESARLVSMPSEPVEAEEGRNIYAYLSFISVVISFIASGFAALSMTSTDLIDIYRASVKIDGLRTGIEAYRIDKDAYPETLDAISKNVDPWGRPYIYKADRNSFTLLSAGPDGREGTDDDIY